MASTTGFYTDTVFRARLSEAGVLAYADDDADGVVTDDEFSAAAGEARRYAEGIANGAFKSAGFTLPITQDDASLDPVAEYLTLDLAVCRFASRRGHSPTESIQSAHDAALREFDKIATRKKRVPNLTYPGDGMIEQRAAYGRPLVANPRKGW